MIIKLFYLVLISSNCFLLKKIKKCFQALESKNKNSKQNKSYFNLLMFYLSNYKQHLRTHIRKRIKLKLKKKTSKIINTTGSSSLMSI